MGKTFLTADPHYGHANIIRFCNRPFSDVHHMNRELVERHNATVGNDDDVWVVGDFAMKIGDRETAEIFYALNGRKHLVIGNHDLDRHGRLVQAIARLPWASAPTHYAEIKHEGKRIVLSHYAALTWNGSHRGSYLAFGHSHGALPALPRSLDVGVDCHGFRPISVDEFLQLADAEGKEAQRRTELVVAELRKRLIPREPSGKR